MTTLLINTGTTTLTASTANDYVVVDSGILNINAGVTVSGVINVNSDSNSSEVTVNSVATIDRSVVVGGGTEFIDGKSLEATLDGGTQWVVGGGVASNTFVEHGGTQNVLNGDAFLTTIASGGTQNVFVGTGTEFDAEFTTVVGGGNQIVLDGSALGTDLEGGVQIVTSGDLHGGFASRTIIDGGGVAEFISGGQGQGAEVNDGEELVEANGFANEDAVAHGGFVDVFALGLVEDENLFGEELVESEGIDFESFVQSGGLLTIQGGALATGEDIFSGGRMVVSAGGSSSDPNIWGGTLELKSGAVVSAIQFTGPGGTLQIDGITMPTATISGFGIGDTIDLTSIPAGVASVSLQSNNVLQVVDGGNTYNLQLDPNQSFAGDTFIPAPDGGSGVDITVTSAANPAPPSGTTADMIMLHASDGSTEIYDFGGNAALAAYPLAQIGSGWQVVGLGGFNGTDTTDMLTRNTSTGAFELYDVRNNNVTASGSFGQVGPEWSVSGFGDFSSRAGETDMLMRNSNTGAFEVYDISNNAITFATGMGQVGLEWSVSGFGDFSSRAGETDMLMRNSNTGVFEVYTISNNTITSALGMGQVGLEWTVAGFGDFSGNANETDMLMRNSNTGALELYDISNNTITAATGVGQVGMEWQVAGFGNFSGTPNETDMLMRDSTTGGLEIYDFRGSQLASFAAAGVVGTDWQVAGVAADPPVAPAAQLTQAMATFSPSGSSGLSPAGASTVGEAAQTNEHLLAAPAG